MQINFNPSKIQYLETYDRLFYGAVKFFYGKIPERIDRELFIFFKFCTINKIHSFIDVDNMLIKGEITQELYNVLKNGAYRAESM